MEEKLVALAFDDGPNGTTTKQVLDVLESQGVPASFFVVGSWVEEDGIRQMKRGLTLGCEYENHSWTHSDMTKLSREEITEEIRRTSSLITELTGREPRFFRPPYISTNDLMFETIDLTFVCGFAADDWIPMTTAESRAAGIIAGAKDGGLTLLHDLRGNDNTVEALKTIIPELKKQGYTFVTVSQLFDRKGVVPGRGKIYSYVTD